MLKCTIYDRLFLLYATKMIVRCRNGNGVKKIVPYNCMMANVVSFMFFIEALIIFDQIV